MRCATRLSDDTRTCQRAGCWVSGTIFPIRNFGTGTDGSNERQLSVTYHSLLAIQFSPSACMEHRRTTSASVAYFVFFLIKNHDPLQRRAYEQRYLSTFRALKTVVAVYDTIVCRLAGGNCCSNRFCSAVAGSCLPTTPVESPECMRCDRYCVTNIYVHLRLPFSL